MDQTSDHWGSTGRDDALLARWPGRCPHCAGPIRRGDLIVEVDGRYLHDDCDRAATEREGVVVSGFTKVPNALACDPDLSILALAMYVAIRYHARPEHERPCWAGQKTLAAERGLSRAHAQRGIDELERAGYIEVERRPGATNLYWIEEPEEKILPSEEVASPAGTPPGQDAQVASPAGTPASPAGTLASPAGGVASPASTEVDVGEVDVSEVDVEEEDTRANARIAPSLNDNGESPVLSGHILHSLQVEPKEPDVCECEEPKRRRGSSRCWNTDCGKTRRDRTASVDQKGGER